MRSRALPFWYLAQRPYRRSSDAHEGPGKCEVSDAATMLKQLG